MEQMRELNLDELEKINGGGNEGGYERRPREKSGCFIYKIMPRDTLSGLAGRFGTTVNRIMSVNPELVNRNYIVAGHYIYIPE